MTALRQMGLMLAREKRVSTPLVWRRCSWHGAVIGFRAADANECAGAVTDTICPACREKFFGDAVPRRVAA